MLLVPPKCPVLRHQLLQSIRGCRHAMNQISAALSFQRFRTHETFLDNGEEDLLLSDIPPGQCTQQ